MDRGQTLPASRLSFWRTKLPIVVRHFPQSVPPRIPFNDILRVVYEDGIYEYVVRVNDDSEFLTPKWDALAMATLQSFSPPNVGVVGPTCGEGNTHILTHDMVHLRTHMSIFNGSYYPPIFRNWYLDNWITQVYGHERTLKLSNWRVKHHVKRGTRYRPDKYSKHHLHAETNVGQRRFANVAH